MQIKGPWLDSSATKQVFMALSNAGHKVYFVGGCVRNALLGLPVTDLDLATDARPEQVLAAAEATGIKSVPTGIKHGTITLVSKGIPYEVTSFRKDLQTDGRHAVVGFSDSIKEDARRRDFTMNAIYADMSGQIHDPLHGLADLQKRRIRFILNPADRIAEDHLRILRFFRFHAWYGDHSAGMDAPGLAACAAAAKEIQHLSLERITAEISKLLAAADPRSALQAMAQAGVLEVVASGAHINNLDAVLNIEKRLGLPPAWLRRLLVLDAKCITTDLRLTRKHVKHINAVADINRQQMAIPEAAYRHGAQVARDAAILRAALRQQELDKSILDEIKAAAEAVFPLRAADMPPGLTGPALGQKLERLKSLWIKSGFRLSKTELLT